MGKNFLLAGMAIMVLAGCSLLSNPAEQVKELEDALKAKSNQLEDLNQQVSSLKTILEETKEDATAKEKVQNNNNRMENQIKGLEKQVQPLQNDLSSHAASKEAAEEAAAQKQRQAEEAASKKTAEEETERKARREAQAVAPVERVETPAGNKEQKSIEELELEFHRERYRQLQDAPVDDMLVWLASNRTAKSHRSYAYLLEHFDYHELFGSREDLPKGDAKKQYILARGDPAKLGGICPAVTAFHKFKKENPDEPYPHVLLFDFHEDYGGMKQDRRKMRKVKGCNQTEIWSYINHPDMKAAFTVQAHYTDHPKIHSLGLGYRFMKHAHAIHSTLHMHQPEEKAHKTKAIMFNNNIRHNGIPRKACLTALQRNFRNATQYPPIVNTFSKKNTLVNYYQEMEESRFIVSPRGLGEDCYRNYEAVFMGCIPIMETFRPKDGWRRTFDDLPVVWIRPGFYEVKPQWVEREYRRVLEGGPYNWKKVLKSWWIQHIKSFL